ncbi:MAG: hypothetical protein AAF270_05800 [Pseudomonadota bacterium]
MGRFPEIELDEEQFDAIGLAVETLSEARSFEEKLELLLANYVDIETEALRIATDLMVRGFRGYEQSYDARLSINRRVISLLTTARLYIDSVSRHIGCIMGTNFNKKRVKEKFSHHYDKTFDYRFMEALRNSVQHHAIPCDSFSFPMMRDESDESEPILYSFDAYVLKMELKKDKKFKKSILDEMPDKVDICQASREYIDAVMAVHIELRDLIEDEVGRARELVQDYRNKYRSLYEGKNPIGLKAICRNDDGTPSHTIDLLLDWDNQRARLAKLNRRRGQLARAVVLSRTKRKD